MYACGGQASISNVKMWMCIYFELCLDSQQHMIELESEVAFIKLSQLLAARAIDELKSIEEKVQGRLTEQPQPVKIIIKVSMIMNQKQKRHYPINANQGHQWGCLGGWGVFCLHLHYMSYSSKVKWMLLPANSAICSSVHSTPAHHTLKQQIMPLEYAAN